MTIEFWNDAIDRWAGPLMAWLRGRCANPEDVVQETFCRLFQQKRTPENLAGWLFQVALNLAREEARKNQRRARRELAANESRHGLHAQSSSPSDQVEEKDEEERVRREIERMSLEHREVIVARLWGELTWPEIAKLLQVPQTTIYRRYQEAIALLKKELNPSREETTPCPNR